MDSTGTFWLPPASSNFAADVDGLFYFVYYASVAIFFLVTLSSLILAIRYRRRGKRILTSSVAHNVKLEATWTVIPTLLVFLVFMWGFKGYIKMHVAPKDAMEIKVTAQKWLWNFSYKEGVNSASEMVVPAGVPVKLLVSSNDVIHSFFVPSFRVKMDVLPNRYTTIWFKVDQAGTYDLYCTEYCGKGHSEMLGKVRVVSEQEYAKWVEANSKIGEGLSLEDFGAQLYKTKACNTCHSIDGAANTGPTFLNLFGHQVEFTDGSSATADENYLRESILRPLAKVVKGFQPVMPPFQGLLKDQEVDALVAYVKSLKK